MCKWVISVNYERKKRVPFTKHCVIVEYPENLSMDVTEIWHELLKVIIPLILILGKTKIIMKEDKQSFPLLTCEQPNQYGEALYRNGVTLSSASYNASYCLYYAGESSFEVKIEADTNDVTEHPCDDKTRTYFCTVSDKRFTTKKHLKQHKQTHTGDKLYSCTQCEKRFQTQDALHLHKNVHNNKYKCTECGKCCQHKQALTAHKFILERNRLNVLFVANDLHDQAALLNTAEFTVERNHTNVPSVTRHLVSLEV